MFQSFSCKTRFWLQSPNCLFISYFKPFFTLLLCPESSSQSEAGIFFFTQPTPHQPLSSCDKNQVASFYTWFGTFHISHSTFTHCTFHIAHFTLHISHCTFHIAYFTFHICILIFASAAFCTTVATVAPSYIAAWDLSTDVYICCTKIISILSQYMAPKKYGTKENMPPKKCHQKNMPPKKSILSQ